MRKIIAIILVVMLIASMTISANAAGNIVPISKIGISFKVPNIVVPDIPADTVYENAKSAIQSNIVNNILNNWLKAHPFR